jgi:hypothetical protein
VVYAVQRSSWSQHRSRGRRQRPRPHTKGGSDCLQTEGRERGWRLSFSGTAAIRPWPTVHFEIPGVTLLWNAHNDGLGLCSCLKERAQTQLVKMSL